MPFGDQWYLNSLKVERKGEDMRVLTLAFDDKTKEAVLKEIILVNVYATAD